MLGNWIQRGLSAAWRAGATAIFAILFGVGYAAEDVSHLSRFDDTIALETLTALEKRTGSQNSEWAQQQGYVIMVSLDGFRHDYARLHGAKNLLAMMGEGSYVKRLLPSFPSKTFPNHYSIATGMYPATHGLVGNSFHSRAFQKDFAIRDRSAVSDGKWYGGKPLWALAAGHGMNSGTIFWVGSEAAIEGVYPTYSYDYKGSVPYETRIEQVKRWLELPERERPHLIMLYFSLTDSVGHRYGPESEETGQAVRYVDQIMGQLRRVIADSGLPINLIITADHGMTEVTNTINVSDYIDIGESKFFGGPMAMIYTKSEAETQRIYQGLVGNERFETYLQGAVPSYLHFDNPDRIGDIVLITDAPNHLEYSEGAAKPDYGSNATHGYDPYRCEDMGALFVAEGPGINGGLALSPLENIHIYPFVASLLNLEYDHEIDGRPEALAPLLKR